jgi:hypothetical protein
MMARSTVPVDSATAVSGHVRVTDSHVTVPAVWPFDPVALAEAIDPIVVRWRGAHPGGSADDCIRDLALPTREGIPDERRLRTWRHKRQAAQAENAAMFVRSVLFRLDHPDETD